MARIDLIQYRRGSLALWNAVNPVLADGEIGFATDSYEIRVGNGTSRWTQLRAIGDAAGEVAGLVAQATAARDAAQAAQSDAELQAGQARVSAETAQTIASAAQASATAAQVSADAAAQSAAQAQVDVSAAIDSLAVGQANGVATLDAGARVPESQIPERLGETQLSDTIAKQVTPVAAQALAPNVPLMVFAGDSNTNRGGMVAGTANVTSVGFLGWALTLTGCAFTPVNAGIGGNTSANLLARIDTDVIALNPAYCHVLIGTNDVNTGVPTATTVANITAILDKLIAAGIRVVIGTVQPFTTYTTGQLALLAALNAWIRKIRRPGVVLVDYAAAQTNPADGAALAGSMVDTLHTNIIGAANMGRVLAEVLNRILPKPTFLLSAENDPEQLIDYGRFSNGTTALPTGWSFLSGSSEVTISRVPRTDGVAGSWMQLAKTAETAQSQIAATATLGAGKASALAVGDSVVFEIEYEADGLNQTPTANTDTFGIYVQFRSAAPGTISDRRFFYAGTGPNGPTWARKGVMRTPPQVIPAGTVGVRVVLALPNTGTYRVDRAALRKATAW